MPNTIPSSTLDKFTTFGDLLRFLRRRAGLTQLEFSIAVGYSDSQISRLEQNMRLPDPPMIAARFVPALYLEDEPQAVERLLELAANIKHEDAPVSGLCPYKGLDYFDEADADLFVGREGLTDKLIQRVLALIPEDAINPDRLFAVVGASGSGKSSLVRAGVIPALRRNKISSSWPILVFTPTAHPLESLASTLEADSKLSAIAALMDDLEHDPRSLNLYIMRQLRKTSAAHMVLVIDQFEEVFAHCHSEQERSRFIDNLMLAASAGEGQAIIIIILRADFYAHCASYPSLRKVLTMQQEYIGDMSDEEMRRAIEEPARRGRWDFEPGLVDLILHDVGHEPGALPLLSHALLETWQRRQGRTLTLSGYASAGGVRGAIAETAEAVYTDRFTHEQQAIARRIFIRLTELGDETRVGDTRRRVTFDELILKPEEAEATQVVLHALADARLVTTSEDAVQIAHEALIREWPTLRGWLEENREGLRLHRQLTETSREWLAADHEPGLLFRGARLAHAQEWAISHAEDMNPLEREFLAASLASSENEAVEREAQHQRELESAQKLADTERQRAEEGLRQAQRLRRRSIVISIVGAMAILLAGFASFAWRSSALQSARNRSLSLAAAALRTYEAGQGDLALLLAKESIRLDPQSLEAVQALRTVASGFGTRAVLNGHSNEVKAAAISPDAKTAFSGSCARIDEGGNCLAGELILWDLVTGKEARRWNAHSSWITAVAFSADGQQIVSGAQDGSLIVWDKNGNQVGPLLGHSGSINDLVAVPNSSNLLAGSEDGYLILWDLNTRYVVQRFEATDSPISAISVAGEVPMAVSAHESGKIILWDLNSREAVQTFFNQGRGIKSIVLSPDGRWIYLTRSGAPDLSLSMISSLNGEEINKQIFTCVPSDFAISPDYSFALITCTGTLIQIDLQNWAVQKTYIAHGGVLSSISISQDGHSALSSSQGGELRVWNTGEELQYKTETTDADILNALDISHDGKYLLLSDATKNSKMWPTLWDIGQNTAVMTYTNYGINIVPGGLKISPDNHTVAATGITLFSAASDIKIWSREASQMKCARSIAVDGSALDYSPDGKYLLVGLRNLEQQIGRLVLLDTETCLEISTFAVGEDVYSLAFNRDGTRAITGSGIYGRIILWDVSTGKEISRFSYADYGTVNAVAFGPQDKTIVGTGLGDIYLWDVSTRDLINTYSGLTAAPWSFAISPDGKYLLSANIKGELMLWDFSTGEQLHRQIFNFGISSVVFSPDGQTAYAASLDGKLITLQIAEKSLPVLQDWIQANRYVREFTCEERQQYHVDPQCK